MTQNMTKGNPLKLIILFSLPMLLGNLFQQMYNMADTFIVGRTLGVNALAAVGSTGSINFLIVGFAFGVTAGMGIVTAQRYGAGDMEGVRRSFTTSVVLTAAVTIFITAISVVFARPILQLMNTPAEILEDAHLYMIIVSWCTFATMLFNLLSSFMRAVGNSRTPLYFLMAACVLNIVLDYALIRYFGMGVEGAAIATILSQLVAGLLCLRYIFKSSTAFRITRADWHITKKELAQHLRLGLPMGFQASIIAVGALVLQFALNGLGTTSVAAFAAASKIDSLATMPLASFGVAMATYTAQNYGAGLTGRIREGVKKISLLSCALALAAGITLVFAGGSLAGLFLRDDAEAVRLAALYLTVNGISYFLLALLFNFRYTLQGLGQSLAPTLAGFMELVTRAACGIFLAASTGFLGASLAGPLAWLAALVPLTISLVVSLRRLEGKAPKPVAEGALAAQSEA